MRPFDTEKSGILLFLALFEKQAKRLKLTSLIGYNAAANLEANTISRRHYEIERKSD